MSLPVHPIIIAHRGASQQYPENTMLSFNKAAEMGAQWLEFDVMLSADDQPLLMHDSALARTTNGHGLVNQVNWQELSQLDAGSWFDPSFDQVRIPHLNQVIEFLQMSGLKAVAEIKPCHLDDAKTAEVTLRTLESKWPNFRQQVVLSSFSLEALEQVRRLDAEVELGLSTEQWSSDESNQAAYLNASSVHIDFLALDETKCQSILAQNLDIFAYTVNDIFVAEQLFEWGVKAIFTDVPDIMLQWLKERSRAVG